MTTHPYTRLRFLKGRSLDDGFALVEGADDERFHDTEFMEWSLIRLFQGKHFPILTGIGEADDLWVSPAGVVYLIAVGPEGYGLHVGTPAETGYVWKWRVVVGNRTTYIQHIWGASEDVVVGWGGGILDPSPDPTLPPVKLDLPTCWMGGGDTWKETPGPGWAYGMGGHDFANLIAVGSDGLVAHWDGKTWKKEVGPSLMNLIHVQVLPNGEIYGASGRVFRRTEQGWKEVGEHLGTIYGLVQWQGRLLVATGHGIYRVEGDTLSVERPYVGAYLIAAGERLLWADEGHIYEIGGPTERSIPLAEVFQD